MHFLETKKKFVVKYVFRYPVDYKRGIYIILLGVICNHFCEFLEYIYINIAKDVYQIWF